MTKRAEAKYKIDRRMGENIWGRPRSPFNKREYGPGQHGQRRKGKATDFGTQLKAKQKLKGYYGNISERQFHKYYVEALRMKGDSSANLIGLLERRLDAVVYRAKFVPTVFAARQFVNHGHLKVNGRRVNIASFQVKVGDVIEIKESSLQLAIVLEAAVIGLIGMALAFAAYAAIVSAVAVVIRAQTGVLLETFVFDPVMVWAPLGMVALCALSGLLPAWKAYRTDVAENLAPIS